MAEITPILQHFQDVLTGKVPFDQIPKSQEDDQYYDDPLECKNICGRPDGAKNKNKNTKKGNHQDLKFLKVNPREEEDPHRSDQYNKIKITVKFPLSNYGSGLI
ncbi:hypothetical protein O181_130806 [Austropuccinia psidii MF-1]|uniref:Uncharacterized protein n=1 Tax=Austropuccinia psidii MF-1 TaxID=1389203 RepID=A0A9Q3L2T7_9BASI|nr:hypothetical protein [Austropuccinia psidii MF-1]